LTMSGRARMACGTPSASMGSIPAPASLT
jgi:hypothetical protein